MGFRVFLFLGDQRAGEDWETVQSYSTQKQSVVNSGELNTESWDWKGNADLGQEEKPVI